MKTNKQRYDELKRELMKLQESHNKLCDEYSALLSNNIEIKDTGFIIRLTEKLRDIQKNGGAYSSAKAVEILWALGKL